MKEQIALREVMQRKLAELQLKNKSFSVRAFAKRLEMQPSATNEILKGKRSVSRNIAEKIADRLKLDPTEKQELIRLFPVSKIRRKTGQQQVTSWPSSMMKLNEAEIEQTIGWIHYGILTLIKTSRFQYDVKWIARRLNSSEDEVLKAIKRLIDIKLVFVDGEGNLRRSASRTNTLDNVPSEALRKAHQNDLDIAFEKLQKVPITERDFSSIVFRGNPQQIEKAREILRKAQDEIELIMDQNDAQEVYKVCTYLFPLSVQEKDL